MITEFGVPTGNGVAHLGPLGRDQGDHSEQAAGQIDADLMRDIADEGFAGGVLFEWADEWFKSTWNTKDTDFPRDRRQLWRNVLTNEEQFGVLAVEPGKKPAVVLDGRDREWKRNRSRRLVAARKGPVREIRAVGDAAYLHLLVRSDARKRPLTLGLDVRPGSNKGLPGTRNAFPQADVAITLGRGRQATIAQAAWTDPLLHHYGLGLQIVPADAADLKPGSGVWTRPTLMLNRPYTVPSTGEQPARRAEGHRRSSPGGRAIPPPADSTYARWRPAADRSSNCASPGRCSGSATRRTARSSCRTPTARSPAPRSGGSASPRPRPVSPWCAAVRSRSGAGTP